MVMPLIQGMQSYLLFTGGGVMMGGHNIWLEGDIMGQYDIDGILFIQECRIYELVDFLMHDVIRLRQLVVEAREQANKLAIQKKPVCPPYPMTAENVFNGLFDGHPAMSRYFELYGGDKFDY